MDSLHFNISSPLSRHAAWTAYTSTLTLHIHAMLHVQPTFQLFLSTLTPCYRDSLHFNTSSKLFRHATWTAYISTLALNISAMLHGQPTFQNLL